jgi:hypothetical protein
MVYFPSVDDTELLNWPQQSRLRGTMRIPRKVWIGNNEIKQETFLFSY